MEHRDVKKMIALQNPRGTEASGFMQNESGFQVNSVLEMLCLDLKAQGIKISPAMQQTSKHNHNSSTTKDDLAGLQIPLPEPKIYKRDGRIDGKSSGTSTDNLSMTTESYRSVFNRVIGPEAYL